MFSRLTRQPLTWIVVVAVALSGAFGLYWFQPWKLFTDNTVNEALPVLSQPTPTPMASSTPMGPPAPTAPRNTVLASGVLLTHEHETSGTVAIVRLADGRTQVVLRDLATSDGPDLRVWLTDQPVRPGRDGWHVFDDGRYLEVGRLKANNGNQVYDVPAGASLDGLTSLTIWCKRFSVSFGAAELKST